MSTKKSTTRNRPAATRTGDGSTLPFGRIADGELTVYVPGASATRYRPPSPETTEATARPARQKRSFTPGPLLLHGWS